MVLMLLNTAPLSAQDIRPDELTDQRSWGSVEKLLRDVEPGYSSRDAREAAGEAIDEAEIKRQLEWSGEQGFLIHVRMQMPVSGEGTAAPFGPPLPLGVGDRPLDAALAALVTPPLDTQEPAPGMAYSQARSFYLWASVKEGWFGSDVKFARLSEKESAAVELAAARALSLPANRDKLVFERHARIMESIRDRVIKGATGEQAAQLNTALTAYVTSSRSFVSGQSSVHDWQDRRREDQQVLKRVDLYKEILTIRGVRDQALPTIAPVLRKDVSKAKSARAVMDLLAQDIAKLEGWISAVDVAARKAEERESYAKFVELATSLRPADAARIKSLLPRRFD